MRTGVAGVGHLGYHHARILRSLASEVRVHDLDGRRADTVASELGVESVSSLEALVDWCDALVVACTTSSHHSVAMKALGAGRHILVEKPIAATGAQAREMERAARAAGAVLAVGHVERFNPAVVAASNLLQKPLFVEGHRMSPFKTRGTDVSVVMDLMIHDIDLVLSFMKAPVTGISASGVAVLTDSVDIASARISFADGAVANMTASRISKEPLRKLRFFQQKRYVAVDFAARSVEALEVRGDSIVPIEVEVPETDPLTEELKDFLECCRTGACPVVGAADGVRALETAELILATISSATRAC